MYFKYCLSFYFSVAIVLFCQSCFAQTIHPINNTSVFYIPEILIGKTLAANTHFPETKLQKNLFLSIGRYNFKSEAEWSARLNYPKTGLSFGYTDFGNSEKVGHAYSLLPFIEFSILKKTN